MHTFKLLTLTILGVLIFGSAGYFGYELFIKPGRIEKVEKASEAAAVSPTPTPDPGDHDLQRLKFLQAAGDHSAARDGLKCWIEAHPKSPLLRDARNALGNANMALLFQPAANPSVVTYKVVKGDSLARIASKNKSNAELIQKANNLPGIGLQIGQELLIPALTPSLELSRASKKATLFDSGGFVKEYDLISSPQAPLKPLPPINTKILDKIATSGTKRVAFGDKAYAQSDRMILLAGNSSIIGVDLQSTNAAPPPSPGVTATNASSSPTPFPLPPGYVLSKEDLLEIFPLVSRNTPVIIH